MDRIEQIALSALTLPKAALPFVLAIVRHPPMAVRSELRTAIADAVESVHGDGPMQIACRAKEPRAWVEYLDASPDSTEEAQRTAAHCLAEVNDKGLLEFATVATQWVIALPKDVHGVDPTGSVH